MLRALAVSLGLLLIAWAEFRFYPGHTYLGSTSQLYLPVLEHLANPGYLSRDLVVSHPNVTYTVYDEVTLFLHRAARMDFHRALVGQQFLFRLAGVVGVFLLARAAGLTSAFSLVVTALFNGGIFLPGLNLSLIDLEPVPRAFAFGLMLLAMGCFARYKPLLAGLFAGLALLYDPATAAPFWLVVLIAFFSDRFMRRLIRPMLPVLLVFVLLLANLSQLQPGTPDIIPWLSRFSARVADIQKFRNPGAWVSLWPASLVHCYLAAFVIGIWATTRLSPRLNPPFRWLLIGLPCLGVLSLPLSRILVDDAHSALALRIQPTQALVYVVALAWVACASAAGQSIKSGIRREAMVWSALCLFGLALGVSGRSKTVDSSFVPDLAQWAADNTWGSSVFLFPDAGHELYPGVFRAQSSRALWVDWESGLQINYYEQLAEEWWERWSTTMQNPLTGDKMQAMLSLPIDYFVLQRSTVLEAELGGRYRPLKPVFANRRFAAYDASTLRNVFGTLRIRERND